MDKNGQISRTIECGKYLLLETFREICEAWRQTLRSPSGRLGQAKQLGLSPNDLFAELMSVAQGAAKS